MLQKTSKFSPYNSRQNYNKCNHIPDEDEVSFDCAIVNHKTTVKIQSTNSGKTTSNEHPHRCGRASLYAFTLSENALVQPNRVPIFHDSNENHDDSEDLHCQCMFHDLACNKAALQCLARSVIQVSTSFFTRFAKGTIESYCVNSLDAGCEKPRVVACKQIRLRGFVLAP